MTTANILKGGLLAGAIMMAMAGSGQAMPASMVLAGNASPPIGHYEFCKANPTECVEVGGDAGPAILNEDRWKEILKVNYTVNSTIQPMTDEQIYGVEERWAYPRTVG
ncbi:transglutaminase-like cysteine peptidase, partial [Salmonella enterica subsp. enterica serovar Enteritidis]